MNQPAGGEPERRHHARIAPKGTVTIHALGNAHYARLANIGVGGMYVATDVTLPDRLLGRVVGLELRFDGALAAWQRLTGQITRIDAGGAALAFAAPTAPALLNVIDGLTTASHASARVISAVLIDADAARRATTADEMCAFVAHYHPTSLLVAIGPELLDPSGLDNGLSDTTSTADLPGRIRELRFAPRGR